MVDMCCNLVCELIKRIKSGEYFGVQVYDVPGLSVLIAFVRYFYRMIRKLCGPFLTHVQFFKKGITLK